MGELAAHDDKYKINMEKHPSFHSFYKYLLQTTLI